MFLFKPALWSQAELIELPRPVTSLRVQDSWDYARFKVPLRDGDTTAGHSRNGVDLAIEGECAAQAGSLKFDEAAMFLMLEDLRARLHNAAEPFQLFLYHDPATLTYRSFKQCRATRFEYDLTDKHLFTYSLAVHACDPVIYDSPPL